MTEPNDRGEIIAAMDDIILSITDGHPIPMDRLRSLPPWRAVMMARLASAAGAIRLDVVEALVAEASAVGGDGQLEPFARCTEVEYLLGGAPHRCILHAGHSSPHDTGQP